MHHKLRAAWVVAVLAALLPAASTQPKVPRTQPRLAPRQVLFKDLFVAVQTAAIYPDGKTFADAVPRGTPDDILKAYHHVRPGSPAALKHFVEDHFTLPAQASSALSPPETVPIVTHIDRLWDRLTRHTPEVPPYSSALPLPRPYVVPGGRFREIYYWDSYFTMLGLAESGRQDLLQDMVGGTSAIRSTPTGMYPTARGRITSAAHNRRSFLPWWVCLRAARPIQLTLMRSTCRN